VVNAEAKLKNLGEQMSKLNFDEKYEDLKIEIAKLQIVDLSRKID